METQAALIANQLVHIERMLKEAADMGALWTIVLGHYPVVSAGSNGDVEELMTYLVPLMDAYAVDAYICGHDHMSEHLQ